MASKHPRARMLKIPDDHSMAGGRLDSVSEETHRRDTAPPTTDLETEDLETRDLVLRYQQLQLSAPPKLEQIDGYPVERVSGHYIPRRIRFVDVTVKRCEGLFADLSGVSADHPGRHITSALHWCSPAGERYHLLSLRDDHPSVLLLTSQDVEVEVRSGGTRPVSFIRDWSPIPESPPRLVPEPRSMRKRYGGDPISICLDGRRQHQLLFIGGVDLQDDRRPDVQSVLNLGEDPSQWIADAGQHPDDRWVNKGEGRQGMSVEEIIEESEWVIERLKAGRRVLVHCSAGMNRSATICCGTLILLEGLSAEAALERVRQQHPWARPDPFHWLNLRWLAHTQSIPE